MGHENFQADHVFNLHFVNHLIIYNNVYSSYMRRKVVGTCTCPVCNRGEGTIKHLLFSCQHFNKQRMEIDDKMCKALPNWSNFDISTKWLLDLQYPDYRFQTCCTSVHELYSEREKHIWLFFISKNMNITRINYLFCFAHKWFSWLIYEGILSKNVITILKSVLASVSVQLCVFCFIV